MPREANSGLLKHLRSMCEAAPQDTGLEAVAMDGWSQHSISNGLYVLARRGVIHKARVHSKLVRYFTTAAAAAAFLANTAAHPPRTPSKPKPVTLTKRPQSLASSAEEVDYSRAVITQGPSHPPRDLSAGAVPYFSALAIGSYINHDSAIARAWGHKE
jgi:hypothetical protein